MPHPESSGCRHLDPSTRWVSRERFPRINTFEFADTVCAECGLAMRDPHDHRRGKVPFALAVADCCDRARGQVRVGLEDGRPVVQWIGHNLGGAPLHPSHLAIQFCPCCGTRAQIVEAEREAGASG
jgi:hypothetical protein